MENTVNAKIGKFLFLLGNVLNTNENIYSAVLTYDFPFETVNNTRRLVS